MDVLNLSEAEILKLNKDKLQKCFRHKEQYSTWFNYQVFDFELIQRN